MSVGVLGGGVPRTSGWLFDIITGVCPVCVNISLLDVATGILSLRSRGVLSVCSVRCSGARS